MPSFLVRSNLARGDLRLYLTNEEGYAQDAASVRWTVFDPYGVRISGSNIPAIKAVVGEYYAPWFSDVRNGNYTIRWEIQETHASAPKFIEEKFFVVDPSSYPSGYVLSSGIPLPGEKTYLSGTNLGPNDLPLFLRNDDGVLTDALAVFWTILNVAGTAVTPRYAAPHIGLGAYYAPWYVNVSSGDYSVLWEFQQDSDSPMQSIKMGFSVINPSAPIVNQLVDASCGAPGFDNAIVICPVIQSVLVNCTSPTIACGVSITVSGGGGCGPAYIPSVCVPSTSYCTPVTIPRTIHLDYQPLPPSGNFTDQAPYQLPVGIKNITFYIRYARGAVGGQAGLQLFWSDGTQEYQETIVDLDVNGPTIMGQQGLYLQNLVSPIPTDDDPIDFVLYVSVPGGAKTTRLIANEIGVPGSPGSVGITLTASG